MDVFSKAPGKLVLTGEYAVLEGAPAIVMAVDRYAECLVSTPARKPEMTGDVPYMNALLAAAEKHGLTAPEFSCDLDRREFFSGAAKLGLGSSAASAVAFLSALCAHAGLEQPALDRLIAIYRETQGGQGSGLDVAASLMGGVVEYSFAGGKPAARTHKLSDDLHFMFIWTGQPAVTAGFLTQLAEFKKLNPVPYEAAMTRLVKQATYCTAASKAFYEAYDAYGEALAAFGKVVRLPVFSPAHQEIHKLAKNCGAVYKPSGAGGGDMGIALATDPERLAALKSSLSGKPFKAVDLAVASGGLSIVRQEEKRRKEA